MAGRLRPHLPVPARAEQMLDAALDRALRVQRPAVLAYLERMRRREPDMTPAELVHRLERHYLAAAMGIGGASGAVAAVPGAGTAASLASGAAEIGAFVSASAMFVLALAELHGVPVSDPDVRRALVLSVLVGDGGEAATEALRHGEKHWAKVFAARGSKDKNSLPGVNGHLSRVMLRHLGAKQGALMIGRAAPLGIGATIGAVGNAALARAAISASRKAFGPAPKTYSARVVDSFGNPS